MSDAKPDSNPTAHATETRRLSDLLADAARIPDPCEDAALAAAELSKADVLVGTVRSDGQFAFCMDAKAYYVPAKTVAPDQLPVEKVALYEEGLSRRAGIKRWGTVTETRVVKRRDIPVPLSRNNPDETYYLFSVDAWQYLDPPIAIRDTVRGKPLFTSSFLLEHCHLSYQLVEIRSPETYRLCRLLEQLAQDCAREDTIFRRVGETHLLTVGEGRLSLLEAGGRCLYTCPASRLNSSPAGLLRGISRALGLQVG